MQGYTAEGWQHTPVWWWDMNQLHYRDLAPGASVAVTVPIDEPATHFAADVIARNAGEHYNSKVRCVPAAVPALPLPMLLLGVGAMAAFGRFVLSGPSMPERPSPTCPRP